LKPSLFTLFKRGRYLRLPPPSEDDDADMVRTRKEAERFTAAAVGFCMSHNPNFARYFLKEICNITASPKARIKVEVEPESWADLLIIVGRLVCVVEFKLGAPLQSHQDPSNEAFWKKGSGYGFKLESAYRKNKKRFVVLGHPLWILLPQREGWDFVQTQWVSLASRFQERFGKTKLLCDLKDCLAQFEIWEFASMKIRELYISPQQVVQGTLAWELLRQAYLCPELKFSRSTMAYHLDAQLGDRSGWHFGIEIQSIASRALQMLNRPNVAGAVMWFGYESERRDKIYRSVWFYCENERIADFLAEKLRPRTRSSYRLLKRDDEHGNRSYVCLRSAARYSSRDFDWFCGWLRESYHLAMRFAPIEPLRAQRSRDGAKRSKKSGSRRSFLSQLRV
jgi:hypothetical protein